MAERITLAYGNVKFSLSFVDIAGIVDSGTVYPTAKSLGRKQLQQCHVIWEYSCDSDSNSLSAVAEAMKHSSELKAIGIKDTLVVVCETLARYPELFTVRDVAGFVFQATGRSCVLLRNAEFQEPYDDGKRFGFMDLTETRRRLIRKYEAQSLRKNDISDSLAVVTAALGGLIAGVVVMAVVFGKYVLEKK